MSNTEGKPWVLGQEWDDGTLGDFFKGAMDEVAFYDRTLTPEEVSSIHENGVKVSPRTVKSYSYDAGGNIQTKEEYSYDGTTGLTLTDSISYSYTDTNWKDKITSYNGKSISYDAIGNPLSYDGWSFTWEAGRQLASMSNAATSTNLEFKYNDAGIRTEKKVNGVTTKYTLNGDTVIVIVK